MNRQHLLTLARSALRSGRLLLTGAVAFPRERLGDVLELPDGETVIVYRETELVRGVSESEARVVLVFGMRVDGREAGETVRDVLFNPAANVATPFFVGMPGFRRKLWLAGRQPGEFLELYEWETRADAERFVAVLESLLAPFDFAGDATFEIVDDDTVDDFVDARALEWRDASASASATRRPSRVRSAVVAACVIAALGYGYLTWKRRSDQRELPVSVDIDGEGT